MPSTRRHPNRGTRPAKNDSRAVLVESSAGEGQVSASLCSLVLAGRADADAIANDTIST